MGGVGGRLATELFADLQACMLHTDSAETPQTLYESSDATEVRALAVEMVSTNS